MACKKPAEVMDTSFQRSKEGKDEWLVSPGIKGVLEEFRPNPYSPIKLKRCSRCGKYKPATIEYFYKRTDRKIGITSKCRYCERERDKNRRKKVVRYKISVRHKKLISHINERKQIKRSRKKQPCKKLSLEQANKIMLYFEISAGVRICSKCNKAYLFTLENFPPNKKYACGIDKYCIYCRRKMSRENRRKLRKNPETNKKILEQKRRYYKSEKGKLNKKINSFIRNNKKRQKDVFNFQWTKEDWELCKEYWDYKCAYCGSVGDKLTQDHFIPISSSQYVGTIKTNIIPACNKCNCSKGKKNPYEWCNKLVLDRIKSYFMSISA